MPPEIAQQFQTGDIVRVRPEITHPTYWPQGCFHSEAWERLVVDSCEYIRCYTEIGFFHPDELELVQSASAQPRLTPGCIATVTQDINATSWLTLGGEVMVLGNRREHGWVCVTDPTGTKGIWDLKIRWLEYKSPPRKIRNSHRRYNCDYCGEDFKKREVEILIIDNQPKQLCEDCRSALVECQECGAHVQEDDSNEYHGRLLCEDCYNSHFETCRRCNEPFDRDTEDGHFRGYCRDCSDNYLFECESCGRARDNIYYAGDGLCDDCYSESRRPIQHYHSGNPNGLLFHGDNSTLFLGVECETDDYPNPDDVAGSILEKYSPKHELFHIEEDGSLDRGFEIITQPCTLNYHLTEFPWAGILSQARAGDGRAHDAETCGLHVHFNINFYPKGKRELGLVKLIYLFERFHDALYKFSRRRSHDYCYKIEKDVLNQPAKAKIQSLMEEGLNDHYRMVNWEGGDTVEIRLWRGTLRMETLLATLEMTDFLARLSRDMSLEKLQHLTWPALMKIAKRRHYTYLWDYLSLKKLPDFDCPDGTVKEPAPKTFEPAYRGRIFAAGVSSSWEFSVPRPTT